MRQLTKTRVSIVTMALVAASVAAGSGIGRAVEARATPLVRREPTQQACVVNHARSNRRPGKARILFMGDSITGNVLVDGDGQTRFERLGYEVQRSATPGFGLLDDPQHGYSDEMALRVASFDPDTVVLEFIGNYHAFADPGLAGVEINTPEFYAAWQAEAASLTRRAAARGAHVLWVLGPAVGISKQWRDRVHVISRGYERLSATLCDASYVDAFKTIGDPWVPGPLRTPDGVHLTAEGGAVLARAILRQVVANSVLCDFAQLTDRSAVRTADCGVTSGATSSRSA
jgi:hypothetical protein